MQFKLGQTFATNGVSSLMEENNEFKQFVSKSFTRHSNGDWGDLCEEDKEMNEQALKSGKDRLLSKYIFNGDISIYIITEWNRSATIILFPSEY